MNRKSKQPRLIYGRIEKGHIPARSLRTLSQDDPKFPKKLKAQLTKNASKAKENAEEEKRLQKAIAQQDRRDEIERSTGKPSGFGYNPELVSPELREEMEPRMPATQPHHTEVPSRPGTLQPDRPLKTRDGKGALMTYIAPTDRKAFNELARSVGLTTQDFLKHIALGIVEQAKGNPALVEKLRKEIQQQRDREQRAQEKAAAALLQAANFTPS